jgi:para-aminobenzoate synthetase / 4-amino-4-deoxychorismate lyase
MALRQDGSCTVQSAPLAPLAEPVRLLLAAQPTDAADLFLRHKTSVRERYDAAWRAAETAGAFDTLFRNRAGELTEGARSSLFVKLEGRWFTPPLTAGVLPGVMRDVLLEDPVWQAGERTLTLDDLRRAERVVVCNALRGPLSAVVDWQAPAVDTRAEAGAQVPPGA